MYSEAETYTYPEGKMEDVQYAPPSNKTQTLCFERWVGQTVYRTVKPTIGPNKNQIIGIRRGRIIGQYRRISRNHPYRVELLYRTRWDAMIDWHTGKGRTENLPKYEVYDGAMYEYGFISRFELGVLVKGGLLETGTPGYFKEAQSNYLLSIVPLYKAALNNPEALFIEWDYQNNKIAEP